jgi:hypothetical protein
VPCGGSHPLSIIDKHRRATRVSFDDNDGALHLVRGRGDRPNRSEVGVCVCLKRTAESDVKVPVRYSMTYEVYFNDRPS